MENIEKKLITIISLLSVIIGILLGMVIIG